MRRPLLHRSSCPEGWFQTPAAADRDPCWEQFVRRTPSPAGGQYLDLVLPSQQRTACMTQSWKTINTQYHTIIRAAFVCVFATNLLRGPLTDLRQTWWVYVGGPRNCPWGVLFRKGQRVDRSTGHFHFPLYYIGTSLTPHSCKRHLLLWCLSCRV